MSRFLLALLTSVLALCGCLHTQPGETSAVIRAEQILSVGLASVDSFLSVELRRRADLPKEVRHVASQMRAKALAAFETANRLRLAYKVNRTAQNRASLMTALAVAEALVAEIRVWNPASTAGSGQASAVDALVAESKASQTQSTGSWVAVVPVVIDLAREIWVTVSRVREAAKQTAEWDVTQEEAFALRLATARTAEHWRP